MIAPRTVEMVQGQNIEQRHWMRPMVAYVMVQTLKKRIATHKIVPVSLPTCSLFIYMHKTKCLSLIYTYTYEYVYLFLFLILGIGYSLTAKDELCGEGVVTVDEIQRCQEAAKEFDLPFKATTVYYTDRPKGCYLDTSDDSVLFNTHSTGSSNSIARQICKPDGKKYTSFHKSLSSLIEKDM